MLKMCKFTYNVLYFCEFGHSPCQRQLLFLSQFIEIMK